MKNIKPRLIELLKEGNCTPQISVIAKELQEPSTTIHYNVKQLEQEGAIKSYKAVFDYKKIDEGFCTYIFVNLSQEEYGNPERVAKEIIDNSNGKKIGETFTFTFNEEKTIKNKEGVEEKYTETYEYSAVIKGIKKATKPALDEVLIKKITKDKVSTESELREQIKTDIQKYFEQQTDDIFRSKLITEIIKNNEFAAPHALVSNVLEDYLKREEEQYKKMGYKKYDKAEASKRLAKSAEVEVKWYLIKDSIQKQENISMSEDELTALATKDAEQTGIAVDKLLNYYKSSNYAEKFVENKVFDFLKANTTIKKVTPEHTHTHNHEEDEHEG